MKITTLALLSVATLGMAVSASADLVLVDDIPTADILLSVGDEAPSGTASNQQTFAYRNADDDDTEGTRGRGNSFIIDAGLGSAYNVSSLSVALGTSAGNGTRGEGELQLTIFEWGETSPDTTTTYLTGTGGTLAPVVFNGTYDVAAGSSLLSTQLLQITFDPGELQLSEDVAYGFFFQYVLDDVSGLTSDITIGFDADVNGNPPAAPAGVVLSTGPSTTAPANAVSTSRDLNYFITGTVVPEPGSLALLGLGGLLIARRRRAS